MRVLALQTDVQELKKQFIVQGEEEILTTARHPFVFLIATVGMTIGFAGFAALIFFIMNAIDGGYVFLTLIILAGFIAYVLLLIAAYVRWKFNFLIVTTEKIVIVEQNFIVHQHVNPIHLEDIERTRFESQFFGLWRCGIVHICLKEREGGTTREFILPYIPQPGVVASAIENAIALAKQREQGEKPEEQLPKVQEVQQKIQESVQQEAPSTPTVQPPTDPV